MLLLHPMERAAKWGLKAASTPKKPLLCQMFVRLCYEHAYGKMFDSMRRASAKEAAHAWADTEWSVPLKNGTKPGDILYRTWGSGGFGHVGIRVRGNLVIENSVVHWNGFDARGTRTLAEFGDWDVVVRLPEVAAKITPVLVKRG